MESYPPPSDFPTHSPEILRPVNDGGARPETIDSKPAERSWAYAPATYFLVGINCLVFVAMLIRHVSFWDPTPQQLLAFGANQPQAVLGGGQWWLVVTAMFVHVGILHLASNMWCLWNLGLLGEPLIGPFGILVAYILSGAAGNLLSIGMNMLSYTRFPQDGADMAVGAGASGAVFGLAGVLIVLLKSPRLTVEPKELSSLRRLVIYFAAINFVIGFSVNAISDYFGLKVYVDNYAHLGGFLGGMIFALPLVPMLGAPKSLFIFRRRIAVWLLSGVLVFFGFYLSATFPSSVWPTR